MRGLVIHRNELKNKKGDNTVKRKTLSTSTSKEENDLDLVFISVGHLTGTTIDKITQIAMPDEESKYATLLFGGILLIVSYSVEDEKYLKEFLASASIPLIVDGIFKILSP